MENVTGKRCCAMTRIVSNQDKQDIYLGDSVQKSIFRVVDLFKVE